MRRFKRLRYIAIVALIFTNIGLITLVKAQYVEYLQTIELEEELIPGGNIMNEDQIEIPQVCLQKKTKISMEEINSGILAILIVLIIIKINKIR